MAFSHVKAHYIHLNVQWTVQILKISQTHSKLSTGANVNKEQSGTIHKAHFRWMEQRDLDNIGLL